MLGDGEPRCGLPSRDHENRGDVLRVLFCERFLEGMRDEPVSVHWVTVESTGTPRAMSKRPLSFFLKFFSLFLCYVCQ